jgi:hypothetical protein
MNVTVNKWRQFTQGLAGFGLSNRSMTSFASGRQVVVVFGAKDTPNGRILTAKGGAK